VYSDSHLKRLVLTKFGTQSPTAGNNKMMNAKFYEVSATLQEYKGPANMFGHVFEKYATVVKVICYRA
jgi:hypothetical protein